MSISICWRPMQWKKSQEFISWLLTMFFIYEEKYFNWHFIICNKHLNANYAHISFVDIICNGKTHKNLYLDPFKVFFFSIIVFFLYMNKNIVMIFQNIITDFLWLISNISIQINIHVHLLALYAVVRITRIYIMTRL